MHLPTLLRRRPSYASVAATLALVVASSGTAFAVGTVVAPNSVDTAAIQTHAVTSGKLAAEAVSEPKIAPGAVTGDKLAAGSVTGGNIADGSVTDANLAPNAVTISKIEAGAVASTKLEDGAVTSAKLDDGAVSGIKLRDGAVTHAKLAANAVTGGDIENDTLHLADFVGIDVSGDVNFTIHAHSCATIDFNVAGAHIGQVAILTWEGTYPLNISVGPLHVANANLITGSFCNLTAASVTGHNIKVRVITLS